MKKVELGQFFTKSQQWLDIMNIQTFIEERLHSITTFIDPFVGEGDLLLPIKERYKKNISGYDIDESLVNKTMQMNVIKNDSLSNIPYNKKCFIITNPPYLGKSRAKRMKLEGVYKYFKGNNYEDVYLLALENCMNACPYGIAIIPETFILQSFSKKHIVSINVIEDRLFLDTEVPVCIVCFDMTQEVETKIYKNKEYVGTYSEIFYKTEDFLKVNEQSISLDFNNKDGLIGLKGVDGTKIGDNIRFFFRDESFLKPEDIKVSSRSLTYIEAKINEHLLSEEDVKTLINEANSLLGEFRDFSKDILIASFKGNNKEGKRRRRLDYKTARRILIKAFEKAFKK